MPLTTTVAGTVDQDDLLEAGIRKTSVATTTDGGKTYTSTDVIVGFVRYDVGAGVTKEVTFDITLAQAASVRDTLKTRAIAAIKAAEGVA